MKKICFLFLNVLILFFSACSGQPDAKQPSVEQPGVEQLGETEEKDDYRVIETYTLSTCTFSDLGVLHNQREGEHKGVCYFFDPVSGREVPLCAKTNCTHQGYSWGNPNPDCDACLSEMTTCAAIIGDSLYYVSADGEDGIFRKKICRADPDGTNRKVLEIIEDAEVFVHGLYEDGYLIYEYCTQTAQDGTPLEKRRTGICLYNLESNEAEYIIEENYNALFGWATVQDHCLYYLYNYFTEDTSEFFGEAITYEEVWEYVKKTSRGELWAYDLNTKEQRLMMQEEYGTSTAIVGYGYAYMDGEYGARLMNLSTGEIRELDYERIQNKGRELTEEGVLLCGEGSIDLWEFDTGEVKHIGSYDENLMISLSYVGQDWVYGKEYSASGSNKIFYLPKEQFMKGDLEWKYLPQKES